MKRLKEFYITIIVILIVIFINIGAFASYTSNVKSYLSEQTDAHIDDIMDEAVECINLKIEEQINEINTVSHFAGSIYSDDKKRAAEVLEEYRKENSSDVLEIALLDGKGLITNTNYLEDDFYNEAVQGNNVMYQKTVDGESYIYFAAPFYIDNKKEVSGVIVERINTETFSKFIEITSVNNNGKVFIVNKDGTLVSKSQTLKNVTSIDKIFPESKYEKLLINSMRSRNSGIIKYQGENANRYIGYSKLDFNKWYVVCIISSTAVEANVSDVTNDVVILGIEMGVMLLFLISYLIYNIFGIRKKSNINLERYYIVSKHSDTIIFDYSVLKDTMYCNEKWEELFGYKLPNESLKENVVKYIFEEDILEYNNSIDNLFKEKKQVKFKCRIIDSSGEPHCCLIKMFPIKEKKDKITKIIGIIEKV